MACAPQTALLHRRGGLAQLRLRHHGAFAVAKSCFWFCCSSVMCPRLTARLHGDRWSVGLKKRLRLDGAARGNQYDGLEVQPPSMAASDGRAAEDCVVRQRLSNCFRLFFVLQ